MRVEARRVTRKASPDGPAAPYLEVMVKDSGIGVSAADQARLFEPFSQIDSTLARRYQGTGLGLAMVKRLTELQGGTVSLKSAQGEGLAFTVWLPWRTEGAAGGN